MNIAVLGSNCKFSSDLAVRLNLLKKSSLVYRYDALASFKKDIPLYSNLLSINNGNKKGAAEPVDMDMEIDVLLEATFKTVVDRSSLGQYIGDVETQFIDITNAENSDKVKILRSIFDTLNTKVDDTTPSYGEACVGKKLKENIRNSAMFSSNLLNIINVYSGIITKPMLNLLLGVDPLTLIIRVKNNNTFLPCTITDEEISEVKKKNPQVIILEVSTSEELFLNNFFIATFGLNKVQEKKKETIVVEMPQQAVNVQALHPNIQLLHQEMMREGLLVQAA
jgi:hypothetical protein